MRMATAEEARLEGREEEGAEEARLGERAPPVGARAAG
jgi:hypothetical protein